METKRKLSQIIKGLNPVIVTLFAAVLLAMFLMPFLYMVSSSLKTPNQFQALGSPIWPAARPQLVYEGENTNVYTFEVHQGSNLNEITVDMSTFVGKTLDVYTVPLPDGSTKDLALVKGYAKESIFLDPDNPQADPFLWEGSYRALDRPWVFSPAWSNYMDVWEKINYPRLLWNTSFYAITTTIATLLSCTLVAFGFSRFKYPGRDFLFVVLISTIFLPGAVTVIPQYTFYTKIGWVGSWLPLIVPAFFANAYDVFLLRQYFMTLPRELDEAAMIDGAGPLRVLWSVVLPQSYPALLAVTIFHIVWSWNDYFGPLIYLGMDDQPISVALARFNGIYGQQPQMIQAGSLMTLIIPLIIFLLAQRFFIQGIVITGVEK
ncbi:MAG: carbohydrate ABC transporter permease [Anaerolineales bacterium]|nr:carbohydrate ABC transporter permease [Anaerolineales bacterium]